MFHKVIIFLFILEFAGFACLHAQKGSYDWSIAEHRKNYKIEFLSDHNSPLTGEDTAFLQFYAPNPAYIVNAHFEPIKDEKGFAMQTHSGVEKKYFVYGSLSFRMNNTDCKLYLYQSEKLREKEGMEDYLFVPFTDETNYTETFGGGRYLDFKVGDISNRKLVIDFNKCYNPYCAYKEGYSCPIPPRENDLKLKIEAGEKLFGQKVSDKP